jgi:cell shape-determining protein MreD
MPLWVQLLAATVHQKKERNRMYGVGGLLYIVIGFFVANAHGYLGVTDLMSLLSAALAVILWPLLFFGIDLHLGPA